MGEKEKKEESGASVKGVDLPLIAFRSAEFRPVCVFS
jgi:hypothetical protein